MTISKILFFVIFLLNSIFFVSFAQAYQPSEGKISVLAGPFVSRTDFKGTRSGAKAKLLGDLGLIVSGDLNDHGGLELSLFHMRKLFFRDENSLTVAEQTELIDIEMGYRYWLSPIFSTGLAFSSTYAIGDHTLMHSDYPAGQEIDTSARDGTEYGFNFSVQSELWNKGRYSIVADARYLASVTNKKSEHGNHYLLLIGLKYLFQEKNEPNPNQTLLKN